MTTDLEKGREVIGVFVPMSVLEEMAEIGIETAHDDNGPGRIYCSACGASTRMIWQNGGRNEDEELAQLAHSSNCPAKFARAALAAPAAPLEPEVEPCPRCGGSGTITVLSDSSPDAHNVDADCDQCHGTGSAADAAKHLAVDLSFEKQRHMKLWGEFRNFHRSLCDRFGYSHDPIDFRRDLVSLEEAIAAKIATPQEQPSDEAWLEKFEGLLADYGLASLDDRDGPRQELYAHVRALLTRYGATPQGREDVQPVAWRHSKTMCLYETEEEVPLADGDEWAEPLCLCDRPQPAGRDAREVPDEP